MEQFYSPNLFINEDYKIFQFNYQGVKQNIKHCNSACTDFDLTGQVVWPASEALAEYIIDNYTLFLNANILQLGAGAGLSGLVAANYANNVIITDGNEQVMKLLKINGEQNNKANKIQCLLFEWNDYERFYEQNKKVQEIDWIIGADILFWPQSMGPLCRTTDYLFKMQKKKGKNIRFIAALKLRSYSVQIQFEQELKKQNLMRKLITKYKDIPIYQFFLIQQK